MKRIVSVALGDPGLTRAVTFGGFSSSANAGDRQHRTSGGKLSTGRTIAITGITGATRGKYPRQPRFASEVGKQGFHLSHANCQNVS
jgi:hypothetical protein